jgi:hypothetical protein
VWAQLPVLPASTVAGDRPRRRDRGHAGANTAVDHIDVLGWAIAQIPPTHLKSLAVCADGAGASHDLLDWLTKKG